MRLGGTFQIPGIIQCTVLLSSGTRLGVRTLRTVHLNTKRLYEKNANWIIECMSMVSPPNISCMGVVNEHMECGSVGLEPRRRSLGSTDLVNVLSFAPLVTRNTPLNRTLSASLRIPVLSMRYVVSIDPGSPTLIPLLPWTPLWSFRGKGVHRTPNTGTNTVSLACFGNLRLPAHLYAC